MTVNVEFCGGPRDGTVLMMSTAEVRAVIMLENHAVRTPSTPPGGPTLVTQASARYHQRAPGSLLYDFGGMESRTWFERAEASALPPTPGGPRE